MARVEISRTAADDLDALIASHGLPGDTRRRVAKSLSLLEEFPLMGPGLPGAWSGFRFLLGPWRWMILVYTYAEGENRVVVVTIQDGRQSSAATNA